MTYLQRALSCADFAGHMEDAGFVRQAAFDPESIDSRVWEHTAKCAECEADIDAAIMAVFLESPVQAEQWVRKGLGLSPLRSVAARSAVVLSALAAASLVVWLMFLEEPKRLLHAGGSGSEITDTSGLGLGRGGFSTTELEAAYLSSSGSRAGLEQMLRTYFASYGSARKAYAEQLEASSCDEESLAASRSLVDCSAGMLRWLLHRAQGDDPGWGMPFLFEGCLVFRERCDARRDGDHGVFESAASDELDLYRVAVVLDASESEDTGIMRARCWNNMAYPLAHLGRFEEALGAARTGLAWFEQQVRDHPHDKELSKGRVNAFDTIADVLTLVRKQRPLRDAEYDELRSCERERRRYNATVRGGHRFDSRS